MPVVCRFNRRRECVFEHVEDMPRRPLKTYTLDGDSVALVYDKNARLEKPIAYDKIMEVSLPRIYPLLARIKNMVSQTVANDKTIIAPKPYKHIIAYTYEKR